MMIKKKDEIYKKLFLFISKYEIQIHSLNEILLQQKYLFFFC